MKKALTLVELMIVVAILGILAAISLPTLQGHTQKAKEAAAKENLRTLRTAIERYTAEHGGKPPGYVNGIAGGGTLAMRSQLVYTTNLAGQTSNSRIQSSTHPFGPYLLDLPENPFNGKNTFVILADSTEMPDSAPGQYGWTYKPADKDIRLDFPGTDSHGIAYFDY